MQLARHGVEQRPRVGEADLGLLRVDVDVHVRRRDLDVHDAHRVPAGLEDRAVGLRDGARERPVAHRASVDQEVQRGGARARTLRGRQVRLELHRAGAARAGLEPLARVERLRRPFAPGSRAKPLARAAPVANEKEADVGPGERGEEERLAHVGRLRPGRLQELAARRDVEEEVTHLDAGPLGDARRARTRGSAALEQDLDALLRASSARRKPQLRDRSDAGERFSPEAERRQREEVVLVTDLARGVALEGEHRVVVVHALAVVGHADEGRAAALQLHFDAGRPGVERVLDQLLDDARGSLDHLAGCDLVGEVGGQRLDPAHRDVSTSPQRF